METKTNNARKRRRNITWYNPPYNKNVVTNIGKKFLRLIDESFPPKHKLHKIINRNTVKISYSCTQNMEQVISSHNKKLLIKTAEASECEETTKKCNCRDKRLCPLDGKCLTKGVIYQAKITRNDNKTETYIGLTENSFKTRYNEHKSNFKIEKKKHSTSLSEYVWKLKEEKNDYSLSWTTIATAKAYTPETKTCNLCLEEKYFILSGRGSINKRNELSSGCRHRKKFLLSN